MKRNHIWVVVQEAAPAADQQMSSNNKSQKQQGELSCLAEPDFGGSHSRKQNSRMHLRLNK